MPDYVTVYQISRQAPLAPNWLLTCVGLLPFAVAAVIVFGKWRRKWRRPNWLFPLFCCCLGLLLSHELPTGLTEMNSEAADAFETGRFSVVEGTVTDFHPMPYEVHEDECFSVQAKRFCYSDYSVAPGFHNAASHGGPIRAGLRVRIAYVWGMILRLDVARDQLLSPAKSTAAAESARKQWEEQMENDPFQQQLTVAFLFTAVGWTFWWNLQWRRAMRFWVRPPNRPITQCLFRIFFGVSFVSAVSELIQRLRVHPVTRENAGPTLLTAAIMICVVGSMTAFALWRIERRDRERM